MRQYLNGAKLLGLDARSKVWKDVGKLLLLTQAVPAKALTLVELHNNVHVIPMAWQVSYSPSRGLLMAPVMKDTNCRRGAVLATLIINARTVCETDARSSAAFWVRQRSDVHCIGMCSIEIQITLLMLVHHLSFTWPNVELGQAHPISSMWKLEGL